MGNLDLKQFKDFFINDVEENLQKLNTGLLNIEKNSATNEDLDQLMACSHSIKGAAATMGYTHMAFLTHIMEDVFDYARHGELKINEDLMNDLFSALDKIKQSLVQIKEKDSEIDFSEFSADLKGKTGVATVSIGKSERHWDSKKTELPKPISKLENKAPKSEKSGLPAKGDKLDYIKVRVTKLDKLMDLSEELLIEKLNLEELEKYCHQNEELQKKFKNIVSKLDALIKETQYQVMESRLVPISYVFMQYPRMVRDLAHMQNKDIELEMTGSDLELDRSIIEKLAEPLNHLLRNAIDHGIVKKGKIDLTAVREKEYAIIRVTDDGAGLDLRKLVEKAVESNLIDNKDSESQYLELIPTEYPCEMPPAFESLLFNPKLSTSDKVTEISGRGVGLNAVKNFADSIGGIITVEMLPHGTCFSLKIPLSLAMIGVLLVRSTQNHYAIPLSSIVSSIKMETSRIRKVLNYDVGLHNGLEFPIIKLHELFNLKAKTREIGEEFKNIVLIKNDNQIMGLAVDELIKEQDVVVKPMNTMLKENAFFSGVSIIGSGKTVPIIDINGLTHYLINSNKIQ